MPDTPSPDTKQIRRVTGYVVPVGNGAVGKSCLGVIMRDLGRIDSGGERIASVRKTVNMEFEYITDRFTIGNMSYLITQQFLIPPGQKDTETDPTGRSFEQVMEIYRFMVRRIDVVLLAYSITSLDSFQDIEYWVGKIGSFCNASTHYILVGTHLDLHHKREVMLSDLKTGAEYIQTAIKSKNPRWHGKCSGIEVSNHQGTNIIALKHLISRDILASQKHLLD